MVRKNGRLALYEAIGEQKKLVDRDQSVSTRRVGSVGRQGSGKIDFSVSRVQLFAVILVVVAAVLGAYKLGSSSSSGVVEPVSYGLDDSLSSVGTHEQEASLADVDESDGQLAQGSQVVDAEPVDKDVELVDIVPNPAGTNEILVASYGDKKDLVPAKEFFANNGVKLKIEKRGIKYYLVTVDLFENPGRMGTDGNGMLMRIKSLGSRYKAPAGCYHFNNFRDAYGIKVKKSE